MSNIDKILNKEEFSFYDIIELLSINNKEDEKKLFDKAYKIKEEYLGKKVYFRGIIEFSNKCAKNCFYCGIRKDNDNVNRYTMPDKEIIDAALFANKSNYGSIVLQSGELKSKEFVNRVCNILKEIKEKTDLGITLCVGEFEEEDYRRFYESGAHRYLLRIETTNNELYKTLHPEDHSFKERLECIDRLKKVGFQTGTGVMIGLPGQTVKDLAKDIMFIKEKDIDMVGMGPYIEHKQTPLFDKKNKLIPLKSRFQIALKMIAILRIYTKDINIAATTALQSIDPVGREKGILVGANVIMPNLTPTKYREGYTLYDNKPCLDESADMCSGCLKGRIEGIGEEIGYGQWGDPKHFFERTEKK